MKTKKSRFTRVLALLLGLLIVLPCLPTAWAAEKEWKDITIRSSEGFTHNTVALLLPTPAVNCKSFRLDVDIDMRGNTKCSNWDVWVGTNNGSSFQKVGTLYLSNGNGSTSAIIPLQISKSFDAVALTPTSRGSYSYTIDITISDIQVDTTISNTPGSGVMAGGWDDVTFREGRQTYNAAAFVLATPATDCASFDIAIEVGMKGKARCKEWTVWVRERGEFYRIGDLYLSNGQGFVSATMYPRSHGSFDAVAVVPTALGSYTYSLDMEISNIVTLADAAPAPGSKDPLPGDYELLEILDKGKKYTVPGFWMAYSVKNCTSFDLEVDVNLKRNARCKEWNVWVFRGSGYSKVDTITLPDGTGYGFKTITFDAPRSFEAVALTPKNPGSYSWDLFVEITNLQ